LGGGFWGDWIWKKRIISPLEAQRGDTVSFFDRFCYGKDPACGALTGVVLEISADNAYNVFYVDPEKNRISDSLAADDEWRTIDGYSLPIPDNPGVSCQHFEIEVVNFPIEGSNGINNPAGLNYHLRLYSERLSARGKQRH